MAITANELENILKATFPESVIKITDLVGDENHYSLEITDRAFADKSLIIQHKMVKDALKNVLSTKLHALSIKTIAKLV